MRSRVTPSIITMVPMAPRRRPMMISIAFAPTVPLPVTLSILTRVRVEAESPIPIAVFISGLRVPRVSAIYGVGTISPNGPVRMSRLNGHLIVYRDPLSLGPTGLTLGMISYTACHVTETEEFNPKLAEVFLTLLRVHECQARFRVKPSTPREETICHDMFVSTTTCAQTLGILVT